MKKKMFNHYLLQILSENTEDIRATEGIAESTELVDVTENDGSPINNLKQNDGVSYDIDPRKNPAIKVIMEKSLI